jgi:hypothetical protein
MPVPLDKRTLPPVVAAPSVTMVLPAAMVSDELA